MVALNDTDFIPVSLKPGPNREQQIGRSTFPGQPVRSQMGNGRSPAALTFPLRSLGDGGGTSQVAEQHSVNLSLRSESDVFLPWRG